LDGRITFPPIEKVVIPGDVLMRLREEGIHARQEIDKKFHKKFRTEVYNGNGERCRCEEYKAEIQELRKRLEGLTLELLKGYNIRGTVTGRITSVPQGPTMQSMPPLQIVKVHNDFDEEMTVCSDCLETINEGIHDDRRRYHSPVDVGGQCELCYEVAHSTKTREKIREATK